MESILVIAQGQRWECRLEFQETLFLGGGCFGVYVSQNALNCTLKTGIFLYANYASIILIFLKKPTKNPTKTSFVLMYKRMEFFPLALYSFYSFPLFFNVQEFLLQQKSINIFKISYTNFCTDYSIAFHPARNVFAFLKKIRALKEYQRGGHLTYFPSPGCFKVKKSLTHKVLHMLYLLKNYMG